jgi:hypothetical protein
MEEETLSHDAQGMNGTKRLSVGGHPGFAPLCSGFRFDKIHSTAGNSNLGFFFFFLISNKKTMDFISFFPFFEFHFADHGFLLHRIWSGRIMLV